MSQDEQQHRGGFVPVGELADTLPGFEARGRAMSAQARHHFTTLHQSASWRGCSRCVPCRAPTRATACSM